MTKASIRKLARRGGVVRISANVYDEIRAVLKLWLQDVLKDVVHFVEHADRQTAMAVDVVYALRRRGHTLYVSLTEAAVVDRGADILQVFDGGVSSKRSR